MTRNRIGVLIARAIFLTALLLAGCGKTPSPVPATQTASPTTTPNPTATLPVQATSTPEPLGSPGNPLFLTTVITGDNPQASAALIDFASQLATKTGLSIQSAISPDYQTLLLSLQLGKTHITWLPPLTYLSAQEQETAQVALVTNQFGVYRYGTQFLANSDSGYKLYFDPINKQATGDAAHALVQFAGKRACLVEPGSPAGYIVPMGVLASESIQTLPAVQAQENTSVIRALYIKGICDFGATFAISGDPRTAESLNDLPDILQKIPVVWQTGAVIPNLNLSFSTQLNTPLRVKLRDAILEIAQNPDGLDLLSRVTQAEIAGLRAVDDTFYEDLNTYVEALGGFQEAWIGK